MDIDVRGTTELEQETEQLALQLRTMSIELANLRIDLQDYDGGASDVQIGPVTYHLLYSDHAVVYSFLPRAAQRTDMDISWLVRDSAEAGIDYDEGRLTWLWDVTSKADKHIINENQKGVNSRFYEPGPYSTMEGFAASFLRWYLRKIA